MPQEPVAAAGDIRRSENLALLCEELFTAIVRLRADRQAVPNAEALRQQFLNAIKLADRDAKARGYTDGDIRLAVFAIVAFLDESILNLRKPVFNEWVRKPLQEELFGRHVAGEVFFQNLQGLLGRRDAPETADVLEVHYLCLLLGYLGRYSIAFKGELRGLMEQTREKIDRIRKSGPDLSPHWMPPPETGRLGLADPWTRRLAIGAGACALATLLLFGTYKLALHTDVAGLQQLSTRTVR